MSRDPLKKLKLENKLKNWIQMAIKDDDERQAFTDGLSNLSEKQLMQLVQVTMNTPQALNIIAKQAFQKKIILDKQDKKAWMEMLQQEEECLGKKFLEIIDDEAKKENQ